jgi:hypothetical protein
MLLHPIVYQYLTLSEVQHLTSQCPEALAHYQRRLPISAAFHYWKRQILYIHWNRPGLNILRNIGIPILEYQDDFMGATDYLDGISCNDLTHPIMIGRDCYNRGFLAIRYRCLDKEWTFDEKIYPLSQDKIHCITLFQRYTNSISCCKAGSGSHSSSAPLLYGSNVCLSDEELKQFVVNLFRMMKHQPIIYLDYENQSTSIPTISKTIRCELI